MYPVSFNILNLERRTDRRDVMAGNLQTLGVPYNLITFHKAPDAMEYETTNDLCEAAIADGFPYFANLRKSGKGSTACFWGGCRMLRYIASEEHPCHYGYYNQDDILLKISYEKLREIVKYLENYSHDNQQSEFLILQMHTRYGKPYVGSIEPKPIFPSSYIQHGLYGKGEIGLVLSKKGAAFLLEQAMQLGGSIENLMSKIEPDLPGTFSFSKGFSPIELFNLKFWGKSYRADQDRLIADGIV